MENLKYKELQKIAKSKGIKANLPKADLIKALKNDGIETAEKDNVQTRSDNGNPSSQEADDTIDEEEQNNLNETFEKEAASVVLNRTFDKDELEEDKDITLETLDSSGSDSNTRFVEFMADTKKQQKTDDCEIEFKKNRRTRSMENVSSLTSTPEIITNKVGVKSNRKSMSMRKMTPVDYLSKKNRTPLRNTVRTPMSIQKAKESQIPRFVKFAQKSKAGKIPDFAKMHEKNFSKMDSLDTYIEKKKKITDTVTKQLEKAKALTDEHNSLVKELRAKRGRVGVVDATDSAFIPTVTSTVRMNLDFGNSKEQSNDHKPFVFSAQPKTAASKVIPKQRQAIKTATKAASKLGNVSKSRKSQGEVGPLVNITNNANKSLNSTNKSMNGTPSKKFDLAASLAKPLTYKPHTGKIKPWEKKKKADQKSFSTLEETKEKQMSVIKGVRMNRRAELLMKRRKISD